MRFVFGKQEISDQSECPITIDVIDNACHKTNYTSFISSSDRFYSPLVKSIAQTEGISMVELEGIQGSGKEGRVTKNDILSFEFMKNMD